MTQNILHKEKRMKTTFETASVGVVALRKAMNQADLTIEEWALFLGVSVNTFKNYLKGKAFPSVKVQNKLNPLLGIVNDWSPDQYQYEDMENLEKRGL
jgi:transcriptional regulator with XRE-family HTH domain